MRTLAWLGLLVVVAVAGAGLVLSLDHPRTDVARPELTARAHAQLAPRLAFFEADMARLAAAAELLSTSGREVLSGLRAQDPTATIDAIDAGDTSMPDVTGTAASMRAARPGLLTGIARERLPAVDLVRIEAIDAAITASGDLPSAWAAITAASVTPIALLRASGEHDRHITDALTAAHGGRFADAVSAVQAAQSELDAMGVIRDGADRRGLDVTILDGLLERTRAFDDALLFLYALKLDSGGADTPDTIAALEAVNAARDALPADDSAIIVIVSDLGGADVTPALLRIERARGTIDAAAGTVD